MGSLALEEELKNAICDAEVYFSVTLTKENLSPATEKERHHLGQRFQALKKKYQLGGTDEELPPPRPPKGVSTEEPELYDDVKEDELEQELYDDVAKPGPQPGAQDENYMVMSDHEGEQEQPEYSEAKDEPETSVTEKKDVPVTEETYAEPEQEDYEVVSSNEQKDKPKEEQSSAAGVDQETYEICETDSQKEGSLNANLANLFDKVKANEIQNVLYRGYLNKHRKPGKMFLGSRWQKRYCIVTEYLLYYFKTEKALCQKGNIVLPGYNFVLTSHKNEHEFELSQEGHRTYKFMCENKEEFDRCAEAVKKATSRKLSGKESNSVQQILSQGDSSNDEDTSSMCNYDDVQPGGDTDNVIPGGTSKEGGDLVNAPEPAGEDEEMYELVGAEAKENQTTPPPHPPNLAVPGLAASGEEQELYDDVASNALPQKPAQAPIQEPEEPEEDLYELVGAEAKNSPQPSRPLPRVEEPPPSSRPAVCPPPRSPETHLTSVAPALPPPRTPEPQRAAAHGPALPPPRGSEPQRTAPGPALPPPRGAPASPSPALPPPRTPEVPSAAPGLPPSRTPEPPTQGLPEEEDEEIYDDVNTGGPAVPMGGVTSLDNEELPPPPPPSEPQEEVPNLLPPPPEEALPPARPGTKPTVESSPSRPPRKPKPDVPTRTTPVTPKHHGTSAARQTEGTRKTPKPAVQPKPKGFSQSPAPPQPTLELEPEPSKDIDYSSVYVALWDCKADADDELPFTRGDLVYIYEKLNDGWWVGSLFQPQGRSVGMVPKAYFKEAFDLDVWKREAYA